MAAYVFNLMLTPTLSDISYMSSKSMEDCIPMLDGSNYLKWEKIMSAYLRSKGLWQITSGGGDIRPTPLDPTADPKPSAANIAEHNKEIADWDKENDKALGLIQMKHTINLSTYDELTSCSTWNKLKKAFATPTATAVFNDFQKLLPIKVSGNNSTFLCLMSFNQFQLDSDQTPNFHSESDWF